MSFADDCQCLHRAGSHSNLGCSQCGCALPFGKAAGIDLNALPDDGWVEHEGYPRDFTEQEQAFYDRKVNAQRQASEMGSMTIGVDRLGQTRQSVFEAQPGMQVGDKVALRGKDGKVIKAGLGQQSVGTCVAVDPVSGLVTVQMGNA